MSNARSILSCCLLMTLILSSAQVKADIDPMLKAELATVTNQRDRIMQLVFDARNRARRIENESFPGRLPDSVPEYRFCKDATSGRYDDMRVTYNRVLDSIRAGTATENGIRTDMRDSVSINNAFMNTARQCLSRNDLMDFSQAMITDAWLHILTSYQAMKDKDKKKLSKELDKKVRWKTTRPSGF
jgi:hypothetical protein